MKRRVKRGMLLAVGFLLAGALAGCAGQSNSKEEAASSGEIVISNDYLDMEQYKGLKIEACQAEEVTDETVEENLEYMMQMSAVRTTVTDRPAEPGDYADLKISCSIDGVSYDDLSYDETELLLPEAAEVSMDSEDVLTTMSLQVIGHAAGEELEFDTAIPNEYAADPTIAGKTAHWEIRILELAVYEEQGGDEFAAAQGIDGVTTLDEYRAYLKQELTENAISSRMSTLKEEALEALLAVTQIRQLPQDTVDSYYEEYVRMYEENAEATQMDYAEYLEENLGMTQEEFESQIRELAEQYAAEDLVIETVAEAEGLTMTEVTYEAEADAYAQSYYYTDAAEMEASFGKDSVWASMERDKVLEFLVENAVEVEDASETSAAAADKSADSSETAAAAAEKADRQTGMLLYCCLGAGVLLMAVMAWMLLRSRRRIAELEAQVQQETPGEESQHADE